MSGGAYVLHPAVTASCLFTRLTAPPLLKPVPQPSQSSRDTLKHGHERPRSGGGEGTTELARAANEWNLKKKCFLIKIPPL